MTRFAVVLALTAACSRARHQHLKEDVHVQTFTVCKICVLHLDGHHLVVEDRLTLDGKIVP